MSVSDVTARIQQIQSQLSLLTPVGVPSPAFAGALGRATGVQDATSYPSSTGSSAAGQAVVDQAKKYLGVPYVWGATDPKIGLDCSGLTQLCFKNLGIDIPRVSYEQAKAGTPVDGLANAQPGDLLAFGSPVHHVAIYVGDGKMIEAPRPGKSVQLVDVYETPTAIRRFVAPAATTDARPVAGATPYADLFNAAAAKYDLDPRLLAAVAKQESGFNPKAVSPAGAQGLMQLMPGTAQGLGVTNSFDPNQAVFGAAHLLRNLLDKFHSTDLALAAYNAGPGAVLKYGGIPPYPETQNYVRNVLASAEAA